MSQLAGRFHVVVLSCGGLGIEVANDLRTLPGLTQVTLVTTPYSRKPLGLRGKLKQIHRTQGWFGFLSVLFSKVKGLLPRVSTQASQSVPGQGLHPTIARYSFPDFHQSECLDRLRALGADLGVVAGTYILKKEVFEIPRLGSINLHSGKAPEYRGAAPAFWELYNGERSVGITIHRVASELDAGAILLQELFPLEASPVIEPLVYLERYRMEVLRPNGVRMVRQAVARIMQNAVQEQRQDPTKAKTYRSPDHAAICELRRRVRQRRRERAS